MRRGKMMKMKVENYAKRICDIAPKDIKDLCISNDVFAVATNKGVYIARLDGEVFAQVNQRGVRDIFMKEDCIYCRVASKELVILNHFGERLDHIKNSSKYRWVHVGDTGIVYLVSNFHIHCYSKERNLTSVIESSERISCVDSGDGNGIVFGTDKGSISIIPSGEITASKKVAARLTNIGNSEELISVSLNDNMKLYASSGMNLWEVDLIEEKSVQRVIKSSANVIKIVGDILFSLNIAGQPEIRNFSKGYNYSLTGLSFNQNIIFNNSGDLILNNRKSGLLLIKKSILDVIVQERHYRPESV